MGKTVFFLVLVPLVVSISIKGCNANGLEENFYSTTCPQAEGLVRNLIWAKTQNDPPLAAKLLRLHFHDCFLRGCDASALLDNVKGIPSEKTAIPNLTLGGLDVIQYVKDELEKACPGIVSCADIVALAARDSVSYQFQKPMWEVLTGRRDGNVSLQPEVYTNLPSGGANYTTLLQLFIQKGLNVRDLVVLSGAHTIGSAPCYAFITRLYNFNGKGDADPSLDPDYADFLRKECPPQFNFKTSVEMDPRNGTTFDTHYYTVLKEKKGLLTSDQTLMTNRRAAGIVEEMLNPDTFYSNFAKSMMKMGAIEVLTGTAGNIRKQCNVLN